MKTPPDEKVQPMFLILVVAYLSDSVRRPFDQYIRVLLEVKLGLRLCHEQKEIVFLKYNFLKLPRVQPSGQMVGDS